MRVSDIWEELKEITGSCDENVNFRALTRGIELLANEGLFDPLVGTIDYTVDGSYFIALPRDVKTPIRLNINSNPSFSRSRLFEFMPNTDGSNDEAEIGWQWHARGYSPIQDERKLPSVVSYRVTNGADVDKTITIIGLDTDGREQKVTLAGKLSAAIESTVVFAEIRSVNREETTAEAWLDADTGPIGQYYPDETVPNFRVIKLSATGVAVRMIYRKHVFQIKSQNDIIPLHSAMAALRGAEAARMMLKRQYEEAKAVLEEAKDHLKKEQASREDDSTVSQTVEIQTAINSNINTNDVLIVADIYDMAAEIFGGIGRQKLFDRITDAINALQSKAQWDSQIGWCDIWKSENCEAITTKCCKGDGFFVLPRYVKAVLALNKCGIPQMPRNRWFEYHLNGTGETSRSSCGTWDDLGDVVVINQPRLDPDTRKVIPFKVLAIPDSALDNGAEIRVFGIERLSDGTEVEVYRDGAKGWLCPCNRTTPSDLLEDDAPSFVRVERIVRDATNDFVRFYAVTEVVTVVGPETIFEDVGTVSSLDGGEMGFQMTAIPTEVIAVNDIIRITGSFPESPITRTVTGVSGNSIAVTPQLPTELDGTVALQVNNPEHTDVTYTNDLLLGYWYPDELEPVYRMIKLSSCREHRIRIRYRKRTHKISSLYDVINLRSRLAMENMMRGIASQKDDPKAALTYEEIAVRYLEEEQRDSNPISSSTLQFDPHTCPALNDGIQ